MKIGARNWWVFGLLSALLGLAIVALFLSVFNASQTTPIDRIYLFEGLRGPLEKTVVAAPRPAADADFSAGAPTRLAILLTDPDSAWLGLVHGLKSIGVPFCITRDYQEALRHHVVLVYPTISGRVLPQQALVALARFPEQGGTLMAVNVEGGGLEKVFGFTRTLSSRARSQIVLDPASPLTHDLDDERERSFRFSNPQLPDQTIGSLTYLNTGATPLARFDDGSAAITSRQIGQGHAYAFGVDLGFLLLKGYNNREQGIARAYANEFEPALDVVLRLLANIYRAGEPAAATLYTVPQGKPLAVVISHDIDYTRSVVNSLRYAAFEREAGIRATYFVQTKYVRDWNDDVFFNKNGVADLARLQALGVEIASHSVAHSRVFNQFDLGSGAESYPDYRPFVRDAAHTVEGSILGELRVSRFLLEQSISNLHITTFRPGHLRNPYQLPQALEATGYRYSSSATANNSLTHLPFRLTYGRENAAQSAIYEFPVTIEDEAKPPLEDRLRATLALADKLARYGALMMVLIHPDVVEPKLGFERELVGALRDHAWFGALDDFGAFWTARDRVELDGEVAGAQLTLRLRAPEVVHGLAITPPPGYHLASTQSPGLTVREVDGRLVIDLLQGEASLLLIRDAAGH